MITVWAVVGDANMRKTSTIRALTGVGSKRPRWDVAFTAHGTAAAYVHPAGLQEMKITPAKFIQEVRAAGVSRAIVALRYHAVGQCPNAAVYLSAFQSAGWTVAGQATLGRATPIPHFRAGAIAIPNSSTTPPNLIADQLRNAWGIE